MGPWAVGHIFDTPALAYQREGSGVNWSQVLFRKQKCDSRELFIPAEKGITNSSGSQCDIRHIRKETRCKLLTSWVINHWNTCQGRSGFLLEAFKSRLEVILIEAKVSLVSGVQGARLDDLMFPSGVMIYEAMLIKALPLSATNENMLIVQLVRK